MDNILLGIAAPPNPGLQLTGHASPNPYTCDTLHRLQRKELFTLLRRKFFTFFHKLLLFNPPVLKMRNSTSFVSYHLLAESIIHQYSAHYRGYQHTPHGTSFLVNAKFSKREDYTPFPLAPCFLIYPI